MALILKGNSPTDSLKEKHTYIDDILLFIGVFSLFFFVANFFVYIFYLLQTSKLLTIKQEMLAHVSSLKLAVQH